MEKKCELKRLDKKNLELILGWRNHPDVRKYMYTRHEISLSEHQEWFDQVSTSDSKEYFLFFLQDIPVGVIGFMDIRPDLFSCVWAFYADPAAPRGCGTLMEFFALEYIFEERGISNLNCEVLSFNASVIKLHKKFGFTEVETKLMGYEDADGKKSDIVELALSSNDWSNQSPIMRKKLRLDR